MSMEKTRNKTRMLVLTALFAAIIVVLQFLPVPAIGPVAMNLSLVPLVLGAVLYGPVQGGILGAIMGVAIIFQIILRPDLAGGLATGMFTMNPFVTGLLCVVKTSVAGVVAGLVAKWLTKVNRTLAVVLAAAVCPIVNTSIFLFGLCVIFNSVLTEVSASLSYSPVMFVLMLIVLMNFVPELVINIVVSPIIVRVSEIIKKKA